jgi:hypothetical protein
MPVSRLETSMLVLSNRVKDIIYDPSWATIFLKSLGITSSVFINGPQEAGYSRTILNFLVTNLPASFRAR